MDRGLLSHPTRTSWASLIRKHLRDPDRGAGVLSVHRFANGPPQVLLCRRQYAPAAGQFGLIGGGMAAIDGGSYARCPAREVDEETAASGLSARGALGLPEPLERTLATAAVRVGHVPGRGRHGARLGPVRRVE